MTPDQREKHRLRMAKWRGANQAKAIHMSASLRAKSKGIPFTIEVSDIIIPEYCPVLGIKLKARDGKLCDSSPSLDRIIPALGYVKGNVIVISNKANRIKSNATPEEIRRVADFFKHLLEEQFKTA